MASDHAHAEAPLSPELIAHQGFVSSRRGFDPEEVRAFLTKVAAELRSAQLREAALEADLRDAEHRAAHPTWDQDTLMSAVGEETAGILRSAHAAGADIKNKAEENASRILKEAHERADSMRTEAETVLARRSEEADAAAGRIREAAEAEAEGLRDQARQHAETLRQRADVERRALVEAAQVSRERILADLTRKRKVAMVQIEQLRAGRERLLESYKVVRRTLDEVTSELARADTEARAAAEAAGRHPLPTEPPPLPGSDTPTRPAEATTDEPAIEFNQQPATEADHTVDHTVDRTRPDESAARASATGEPTTPSGRPRVEGPGSGPVADAGLGAPNAEADADADPPASVDTLFARIRADREEAVAKAKEVLSEPSGEPAGPEEEPPVSDGDGALLQRRDAAIGSIEASMGRKLKRALQDEQNDLLDRLRGGRSQTNAAALLPEGDAHAERFVDAGRPLLEQAARAGAEFVRSLLGAPMPDADELPGLSDLATDLADAIVGPLRRRLEEVLVDTGDDDPSVLVESVGSAYREWKTQRIELIAADHVAAAFARGAFAGTPDGATLRWLVQDVDGPCPDCDDNALAGEQPKGELFPTGQRHPPAHAGCRCLLVPKLGSGQDGS